MSTMNQQDMQLWLTNVREKLTKKMAFALDSAKDLSFIPYTTLNGTWRPEARLEWISGFWGAELWQMYLMTGDRKYRDAAVRAEEMNDPGLPDYAHFGHDLGFMWLLQSGVHHRLENDFKSRERAMFCANILAGRFNPNGFLRAWEGEEKAGWAIIDCMMNLPLLYWATRQSGDPRYQLVAMKHADTAMKYFVREDGSCNHIVCFDPCTGEYLDNPGGQGYAPGSSWSRGQAWGLYGFTLSYLSTQKEAYLETAARIADYYIDCVQKTDWSARCDFRAPETPVFMDNAADAIAASGLLTLAECFEGEQRAHYQEAALKLLAALDEKYADWTEAQPMILTHCSGAYYTQNERHITMTYADYFFIEAVQKLLGSQLSFWMPDR